MSVCLSVRQTPFNGLFAPDWCSTGVFILHALSGVPACFTQDRADLYNTYMGGLALGGYLTKKKWIF